MAKWATGKRSQSISDRSGQAFPYLQMVKEWTGALVHYSEYEPKHPQIRRRQAFADAIALQNTRPQRFQQPTPMDQLNPIFGSGDPIMVNSGGASVGVADLTLPGMFAFGVQTYQTTSNGITTSIGTMVPEDPSLQNRRRQLGISLGNITVSIT